MSSEGQSKDEQTLVPPVLRLGLRSDGRDKCHLSTAAVTPPLIILPLCLCVFV